MKTINSSLWRLATTVAAVIAGSLISAQTHAGTTIGSFPPMNGGFEGETVGTISLASSIASNTVSPAWTVNSGSSFIGVGPSISATGGRSGPYFVTNYSDSSSSRRLQSPTVAGGTVQPSTQYVIQYYYRTPNSTIVSNLQGGVSSSATTLSTYSTTANFAGTGGAWTKFVGVVTSDSHAAPPTSLGIGIVRFSNPSTNPIDVDDFVVYAGSAADTTAPDPVTSPATANATGASLDVSWTAPGTGVDGGGYLVVRGTADPVTAPNVNGIYAVGNTIGSGTVAYIGTGTSFTDSGLAPTTQYFYRIYTVDKAFNYAATAGTTSGTTLTPIAPIVTDLEPASSAVTAGSSVTFSATLSAGSPPLTFYWYTVATGGASNLLTTTSTTNLTIASALQANSTNYEVVASNSVGTSLSPMATLVVTGDPNFLTQPASQQGMLSNTVQFAASAVGTSLSYQWYYCTDPNNPTQISSPVVNGRLPDGSGFSGATSSTLIYSNLQAGDPTNFVLIITNIYGVSVSSSVASLLSVANTATLAFWNFNGNFNSNNPAPYQGAGTASLTNCSGFAQTSADGLDFTGGGANHGWGTSTYPASGQNTNAGVQFFTSTVGAKNIVISFDIRGTSTASKYHQLQYTTDGVTWINYPTSSSYTVASTWLSESYNLSGFPGVANNSKFGFRVVSEYDSTAHYGATNDAQYVGLSSTYASGGTVSFDVVTVTGDAITNAFAPPVIGSIANLTTNDDSRSVITASFPVTGRTPISVSATSSNQLVLTDSAFAFGTSGANTTLSVTPQALDGIVPVIVTATDVNSDLSVAWFYMTINPANLPPTNTLTVLLGTNVLANKALVIPFTVGDDRTSISGLTFATNSGNSTLIPGTSIGMIGQGTASPSVIITPVTNSVGVAPVTVTVNDNDLFSQAKSTSATFPVMVVPNTNVVFVDNFDYDTAGPIISESAGLWNTHSGTSAQLAVGGGVVTVDQGLTEDCNAKLIGAPYMTNSGVILYCSFIVNFSTLPTMAGTYFEHYLDLASIGAGTNTAYGARVYASTTNAVLPNTYRLGICNGSGGTNTSGQFPLDLQLNTNYTVVTRFVLTNGISTIWINPSSESSPGVTANDQSMFAPTLLNAINVTSVALRENTEEGVLTVDNLRVGLNFDSVLPAPQVQPGASKAVVTWSDPSLYLLSAPNVAGPFTGVHSASPYTNNSVAVPIQFFRLTNQPPQ